MDYGKGIYRNLQVFFEILPNLCLKKAILNYFNGIYFTENVGRFWP